MKFLIRITAVLFVVGLVSSAAQAGFNDFDFSFIRYKDEVEDVNEDEATLIAYLFFRTRFGLCGTNMQVKKVGNYWVSETYAGIGAQRSLPIYINASTGVAVLGAPGEMEE